MQVSQVRPRATGEGLDGAAGRAVVEPLAGRAQPRPGMWAIHRQARQDDGVLAACPAHRQPGDARPMRAQQLRQVKGVLLLSAERPAIAQDAEHVHGAHKAAGQLGQPAAREVARDS